MIDRLTSRPTIFAAAGTLFVTAMAALGVAMATGHDPATERGRTSSSGTPQGPATSDRDERYADPSERFADPSQGYADPSQGYADPGQGQGYADPGQAGPPVQSGTS
jgi:hypothetical protein